MRFSVITQNCFDVPGLNQDRMAKIDLLVKNIVDDEPNLICMQELTFPGSRKQGLRQLAAAGYQTYFEKTKLGFTKSGLVLATKYPIIETRFVKYKDQGKIVSMQIADRVISKGYQVIKLAIDHKVISIVNTHAFCVYDETNKTQLAVHKQQLEQLTNMVTGTSGTIILVGDLSEKLPSSILLERFLLKTGLVNLSKAIQAPRVDPQNTNVVFQNTRFRAKMTGGFYDFMLTSKDLIPKLNKIEMLNTEKAMVKGRRQHLSDHFGLGATFLIT